MLFSYFRAEISCYQCVNQFISNITEKQVNGFSWNFQDRSNMRQVTILIFIFSVSILTKNITEKLVNGFQWHFHDVLDTEQQNNWHDSQVQINWFLVPQICAVSCLSVTVWKKWLMDFVNLAGCHTRTIWYTLGTLHFTPLKQHFLPSGSVFVSNSMEGEWMFAKHTGSVGYDKRKTS